MLTQQALTRAIAENPRMTQEELGVVFGVSDTTIADRIGRWGISYESKKRLSSVFVGEEELGKLISAGFNQEEMAKIMGVSGPTISKRIKKFGLSYDRTGRTMTSGRKERSFESFRKKVRLNYAVATVRVKGELMMLRGRLVGKGKEWFEEKVKRAFARRGEYKG